MKNTTLCALLLLLTTACTKVDDYSRPGFVINQSIKEWLAPFNEVDKEFSYTNDSQEVATIRVTHRNFPTSDSFSDCFRNDGTFQCQYTNTTLAFSSDTSMYLTAWLFGEDRLTLNYSDSPGLTPEIVRYREYEGVVENPQSDHFQVTFVPDYNFANSTRNAFVIRTTQLDGLFGALPPKSFVLVKGAGIVAWSDYTGNVWTLNN